MFDNSTRLAIAGIAKSHALEPAMLSAVAKVESGGVASVRINGVDVPLIRIEGHYFFRLLSGEKRAEAVRQGLAHPSAGRVKNPKRQIDRYRMLERMKQIDKAAAIMSCSWGVGQVMGEHCRKLGFADAVEFMRFVMARVANQVEVMARYIDKFGLRDELQRHDFAGFARGYNGPNYAKWGYHIKIAKAYAAEGGAVRPSPARGMLRMGSSGARVRELQVMLRRAGYAIDVDGDFGTSTKAAVAAYQTAAGLAVDGVAGPQTMARIRDQVQPAEMPGQQSPLEVPAAKTGVGGLGGGVVLETAKTEINDLLTAGGYGLPDWLSAGLTAAAAGLAFAGLGLWVYGWWKSRQTVEQPGEFIPAAAA